MRRNTSKILHCCAIFLLSNQMIYSQAPDSTKNTLEQQQTYIRSLVDQQKKIVLTNHPLSDSTQNALNDLRMTKLPSMDSILAKQMKTVQMRDNTATVMKKATSEVEPRKSNVRKVMLIGGLSGGAIVGALAYFLSSGGSKSGEPTDSYIDDKPPVHP